MEKKNRMALAALIGLMAVAAVPGTAKGAPSVNTWVKSEDRKTAYYLDADGTVATSRLVPYGGGTAYVDETGRQVRNAWAALPNEGLWDEPVETVFYYFGPSGEALSDTKRKIDGRTYFFDSEGHMLSGWHEDDGDLYYLGAEDEGWIHTGWQLLAPEAPDGTGGFEQWYYFRANGKACRGRKKINGTYRYFDEDTAAMQEGWVEWEGQYAYYEPVTGEMGSGWAFCDGPEDGEEGWYYLEKDGIPFNYGGKDSGLEDPSSAPGRALDYVDAKFSWTVAAKTMHGDTYLFDENGKMMTGMHYVWEVRNKGGSMLGGWVNGRVGGIYFFDEADGKMLKGRQKRYQEGQEYEYYFDNHGKLYTSCIIDGHLYGIDGTMVKAEYGDQYRIVDSDDTYDIIAEGDTLWIKESGRTLTGCQLIVDRKGRVKKNGRVTVNGYRYTVKDYAVTGTPEELD